MEAKDQNLHTWPSKQIIREPDNGLRGISIYIGYDGIISKIHCGTWLAQPA